ncbi:MAG: hypothetical protein IJ409_10305 [Lachnospiraceae bacterium]|nr:hypothetical protein [Lachnospiraceae bacterium]
MLRKYCSACAWCIVPASGNLCRWQECKKAKRTEKIGKRKND